MSKHYNEIEDIMDKDVREALQEPTDIDYLIENRECRACTSSNLTFIEKPCLSCCVSDNHFNFTEDSRDNIIDRVTEKNEDIK